MMHSLKELKKTAKFIGYVLCVRPDEFGLIPDRDGSYRLKELLQALHEDPQGRTIRKGRLNEMALSLPDPPFEINAGLIRPRGPAQPPCLVREVKPPKLLYTAVRRRAYPHVSKKGIPKGPHGRIVLCRDRDLAIRIGRRKDPEPVLLTVNTAQAQKLGVSFMRFGNLIYVADDIPKQCFTGPPVPKQKTGRRTEATAKQQKPAESAGSFIIAPEQLEEHRKHAKSIRRKKDPDWKRHRRKTRKR